MNHENQIRAAHHHRGLAARQILKISEGLFPSEDEDEDKVVTTLHRPKPVPTIIVDPGTVRPPVVRPTRIPPTVTPIIPIHPPHTTRTPLIPPIVPPVVPTTTAVSVPPVVTTTLSTPPVVVTRPTTTTSSTLASAPLVTSNRNIPTIASSTFPSSSATAAASGGVSTGTLVGGIGGGIVGVGVLGLLVIFLVRFLRKKSADKAAFNATTFRRSALMLDDPPAEKPNPRPPTMIERRLATPAVPPTSYGYEDQPQYGGDSYYNARQNSSPYSGSPYGSEHHYTGDQFGVGAYGQAAGYGAYGAPPTHTPHPQYPQQQQQSQHFPQQYSFSPGQIIPPQRSSPPSAGYSDLPNPFAPNPAVSAAAVVAAARNAAETPIPAPRNVSPTQPQPASYLSRQPTQAGNTPPAYQNEAKYADMQRDVKVAPLTVSNPSPSPRSPGLPGGSGPDANKRPTSTYTVYDPEDAYGGI